MKTLIVNLTAIALLLFAVGCKKADDPAADAGADTTSATTPEGGDAADKTDVTTTDDTKADDTKADDTKADDTKADDAKADDAKADDTKADDDAK